MAHAVSLLAYIGASILAKPDWHSVLIGTLVPTFTFDRAFLTTLVAILGTTISPYLFFWQADEEVEEEIAHGSRELWQREGATDAELRHSAWDVNAGMLYSNVVMYFIILATAATLHRAAPTNIATAADAAQALRPLAGQAAFVLMGLALIGSGVLTVPILTGSAAYALAETFGWKAGLDEKPASAKQFYLAVGASTIAALFLSYSGVNIIRALFLVAVINGFLAPPLLIVIMLIANNRTIMGTHVNGPVLNILGWSTTVIMFAAAVTLVLVLA